jgi:hypothetical protein
MASEHIAYQFRQSIDRLERDAEDSPGIQEIYDRGGLMLLRSDRSVVAWNRSLAEYTATPLELAQWRAEPNQGRQRMREVHTGHLAERTLEVASERALDLSSDSANNDPVSLGAPLPFFALSWPTVLPGYGGFSPEVGTAYSGKVTIGYGFGSFPIGYHCVVTEIAGTRATLEIKIDPKETWTAGKRVLLILKATGSMKLIIDFRDQLPQMQAGRIELSFRSQWKRGAETKSFEIGRFNQTFEYRRILAAFDEETFRATAWRTDAFAEEDGR